MSNSTKSISIIIPVYKDLEGLQLTISDLRKSNIPIEFEIIVCNDGANILMVSNRLMVSRSRFNRNKNPKAKRLI